MQVTLNPHSVLLLYQTAFGKSRGIFAFVAYYFKKGMGMTTILSGGADIFRHVFLEGDLPDSGRCEAAVCLGNCCSLDGSVFLGVYFFGQGVGWLFDS